jgi:hypothetical protein
MYDTLSYLHFGKDVSYVRLTITSQRYIGGVQVMLNAFIISALDESK